MGETTHAAQGSAGTAGSGANEAAGLKVVGVGGAGANVLSYLFSEWQQVGACQGMGFIAMNTDKASLELNPCPQKVLLELDGRYEGQPGLGELAVEQNKGSIAEALHGALLVVLVAGMGGATGTFATPAIARIAKDLGSLVLAMAITPFSFEGNKRLATAEEGVRRLLHAADGVIVFSNDDLLKKAAKDTSMEEAFRLVYDVIYDGVRKVAGIIPGAATDASTKAAFHSANDAASREPGQAVGRASEPGSAEAPEAGGLDFETIRQGLLDLGLGVSSPNR